LFSAVTNTAECDLLCRAVFDAFPTESDQPKAQFPSSAIHAAYACNATDATGGTEATTDDASDRHFDTL